MKSPIIQWSTLKMSFQPIKLLEIFIQGLDQSSTEKDQNMTIINYKVLKVFLRHMAAFGTS
jgi:hypothetical protein